MAKKANFRPEAAFLFSICCAGSRGVDRLIGLVKLPDFSRSRPWSWTPGWVFLSLLVMAGCGTVSRSPSASPTTITIFGLGPEPGEQLRRDALDELTRKTGIQTYLAPTLGTSTEQLAQTVRLLSRHAGTPDVYVIDVIWPGTLAANLLDLTPWLDKDAREQLPELLRNDTVNGRVVSLPFYLNVGMLYFRTDLLKKYGYSHPPNTWDELKTMAAQIQN